MDQDNIEKKVITPEEESDQILREASELGKVNDHGRISNDPCDGCSNRCEGCAYAGMTLSVRVESYLNHKRSVSLLKPVSCETSEGFSKLEFKCDIITVFRGKRDLSKEEEASIALNIEQALNSLGLFTIEEGKVGLRFHLHQKG